MAQDGWYSRFTVSSKEFDWISKFLNFYRIIWNLKAKKRGLFKRATSWDLQIHLFFTQICKKYNNENSYSLQLLLFHVTGQSESWRLFCCANSMISHLQQGGTRFCNLVCLHPRTLLEKEKQFTSNKVLTRNCKLKGSCILQSCLNCI